MKDRFLKLLHKIYRNDEFIQNMVDATSVLYNNADVVITRLANLFHFDRLDEKSCEWWERFLEIPAFNRTIESRRARIRAKWVARAHNDIELIQTVCDSWKNGDVEADFVDGKITLKFIGEYGIPEDVDGLIEAVSKIKPAHLPFLILYKYLLIENIHEVKTIEEMEEIQMFCFSFGKE